MSCIGMQWSSVGVIIGGSVIELIAPKWAIVIPLSMDGYNGYAWAQQVVSLFFSRSKERGRWITASTCFAPWLGLPYNGPWQHRSAPLTQGNAEHSRQPGRNKLINRVVKCYRDRGQTPITGTSLVCLFDPCKITTRFHSRYGEI